MNERSDSEVGGTEDNSRGAAQLIAGEGIVVRRSPLTVAISAAAGNDALAPLVTAVIDRLVDDGELTFAPVAEALQAVVVDHQPLGVAALLDAAPEPILFLFDQAQAIEDEPGHDGRPMPELRHGGKGRVGWNTVLATGPQVTLLVGPMDGSGGADPGWAQIREGTVSGCGARIVLSTRQTPATAAPPPPPIAEPSVSGPFDSGPTAEPIVAASFDSGASGEPSVAASFDSGPTAEPSVAASFDSALPPAGVAFDSAPPPTGAAFDSAPPPTGAAFDSAPPPTGAALDPAPPPTGAAQPPPPVGLPAPPPPTADQEDSVLWAGQPPVPDSQPFPGLPPSPDSGVADGFDSPPMAGHGPGATPPDPAPEMADSSDDLPSLPGPSTEDGPQTPAQDPAAGAMMDRRGSTDPSDTAVIPGFGHIPPPDAASSFSQPPGPNPSPPPPGSSALGLPPPGATSTGAAAPGPTDSGAAQQSAPIAGPPPMPDMAPHQMAAGGPDLTGSASPDGPPPPQDVLPSSAPPPIPDDAYRMAPPPIPDDAYRMAPPPMPGDGYRMAPPPSPTPDESPSAPSGEAPPTGWLQSPAPSQPLSGTPPMPDGPPTRAAGGDEESDDPKPPDSLP